MALSRLLKIHRNNNISQSVYVDECENCSIFGGENLIMCAFYYKLYNIILRIINEKVVITIILTK
ncbi:hypothetical protein CNEO4_90028 [Clostridium neonatale]|nr:hypothetical protein CNEO4_90028 [Clostridium neonatale]